MVRSTHLLLPAALAALGMGCSHNPLVGTWVSAYTVGTVTVTETIEVNADGTLVVNAVGSGSGCTGAEAVTGYEWAATSSSVTFSGTPACTGGITCGPVTVDCSGNQGFKAGSCTYALSNNDDTLALTACSGTNDLTLTRSAN